MKIWALLFVFYCFLSWETALGAVNEAAPSASSVPGSASLRVAQSWDELSPQERTRALENYKRFKKLPPERRQDLEERYHRWREMPNEEKARIQRNYRRYRKMDSDQKEEFQKKYKTWQSTPRSR